MQSAKLNKGKIQVSTQRYLDIAEIKNDTVILKDGSLRAVILVSGVNFSLKSQDEQTAIIQSYVGFLNSFDFPWQIIIQSRKLNIDGYLGNLLEYEKKQDNDLLRQQIHNYREYVTRLVKVGNIMSKNFYIVVPYQPGKNKPRSFFDKFFSVLSPSKVITLSQKKYEERRKILFQRANHVISGLSSMGMSAVVLDTQSLIELYYGCYNLDIKDNQKISQVSDINLE